MDFNVLDRIALYGSIVDWVAKQPRFVWTTRCTSFCTGPNTITIELYYSDSAETIRLLMIMYATGVERIPGTTGHYCTVNFLGCCWPVLTRADDVINFIDEILRAHPPVPKYFRGKSANIAILREEIATALPDALQLTPVLPHMRPIPIPLPPR